jgi:hypothetical protein
MAEFIVHIAPEKEALVKELVEQLGGRVIQKKKNVAKARLIKEIKEAVEEMKLVRAGKKKARNAEEFLNEL